MEITQHLRAVQKVVPVVADQPNRHGRQQRLADFLPEKDLPLLPGTVLQIHFSTAAT